VDLGNKCGSVATLEVKALVDNQDWMIGANHVVTVANPSTWAVYPWFYTTKGSLGVFHGIFSPELNNKRDVIVYYPPSYLENTLKVHSNVLVMHDGQNLFDPATAFLGNAWMIQNTLNPMIYQGSIEEVVVVGAYNTNDRINEYTYSFDKDEKAGGKGDLYLDWIEKELLQWASSTLRVKIDKGGRLGIIGSSLGGLISCYAGVTRPTLFGRVGCMSSSFWWNNQDFQNVVLPGHSLKGKAHPIFYMDSGTNGGEASCA
jgi:predicted alpha/beta superfamily hydrolase